MSEQNENKNRHDILKAIGISAFVIATFLAVILPIARGDGTARLRAWAEETRRPSGEVFETARAAVASMERDGAITGRQCDPNQVLMNPAMWRNLPSDRYREIATRSLALMCEERGFSRSMTVRSAKDPNRILGRYHGNDRFEVMP
jgi:hypothetical protein